MLIKCVLIGVGVMGPLHSLAVLRMKRRWEGVARGRHMGTKVTPASRQGLLGDNDPV